MSLPGLKNKSLRQVSRDCNVSKSVAQRWHTSVSMPREQYLKPLAKSLGVSVDDLVVSLHMSRMSYLRAEKAKKAVTP